MSQAPDFGPIEQDEIQSKRFWQKCIDAPFVPIGMAGFITVLGIGAYKYKSRGNMSTSMFLMQLRVASQGTVVGALTIGLVYSMLNEYVFNKKEAPAITATTDSTAPK